MRHFVNSTFLLFNKENKILILNKLRSWTSLFSLLRFCRSNKFKAYFFLFWSIFYLLSHQYTYTRDWRTPFINGREPLRYAEQTKGQTKSPKYLVRREVEMILRCTEFFWSGRKFNQIDGHFVPSLCKLWHKSYIANRTSFHSFSWCMKLTCANAHSAATKNSKLAKGRILTRNTIKTRASKCWPFVFAM